MELKDKIQNLKVRHLFYIFLIGIVFDIGTTYIGINHGFVETNKISGYFFQFGLIGIFFVFIYECGFFYSASYLIKKGQEYNSRQYLKEKKKDYSYLPILISIPGLLLSKLYFGFHNLFLILK